MQFGAVFTFSNSYGAVRCGFSLYVVRCGADLFFQESYDAVRCGAERLSFQQLFPTVRLSVHRSRKIGVP